MSWLKSILGTAFKLGIGEAIARLGMFVVLAFISRQYGLRLLGALALAQTVWLYAMQGTDLGFRIIGAREIAREPRISGIIIPALLKKRSITGALAVTVSLLYAFFGPMDDFARLCVAGFALAIVPYLFSLDWLIWGQSRFGWLSAWKAGVTIAFAGLTFLGFRMLSDPRVALVSGNFVSALLGSAVLWWMWEYRWKPQYSGAPAGAESIQESFRWRAVLPLGLSVIMTQAFHNADTLLLGAMAPLSEVGRYSSAYKVLFLACGGYYLISQAVYPQLARAPGDGSPRRKVWFGISAVGLIGTVFALVLAALARPILVVIYGSDLGAVTLLRMLLIAVPLDFVGTTLGISFTSRGFDKYTLFSCAAAAVANIACNLVLIPRMGATGAAIATLGSYVLLDICLIAGFVALPVFAESVGRSPSAEAAAHPSA